MDRKDLHRSLSTLFSELTFGAPETGAFVLNGGDRGLLASLDAISAEQASAAAGTSSIASHVRHLEYGISLMNRWASGENPFEDADWAAAWERPVVSPGEWDALRAALAATCRTWHSTLAAERNLTGVELDGVIGSIVHMAYHLGAMRQMNAALRGPPANG